MKIVQVVPRIADQSSGPSYSVVRLCQALQVQGAEVELHVLEPLPEQDIGIDVHAYPCSRWPGARRLGWSPAMRKGLLAAASGADIVHNHSMWMMPNVYSYEAARQSGAKLVFSPRGTLSPWAMQRARLRKQAVWLYGQKRSLFGADALHATSEMEAADMRTLGLEQPIFTIPNGVDIPESNGDESGLEAQPNRQLLFLSRIHPTKGVETLLYCWAQLEPQHVDWALQIAGPLDGSYAQEMQKLAQDLGLKRVSFTGEVQGQAKTRLLHQAELFVLPTHSENFGMAVAEALAHRTPAVVTRGAPWKGLEREGCGWWVENNEAALAAALEAAMQLSSGQLKEMGNKGRVWMQAQFSWTALAAGMLAQYRALRRS